MGSSGPARVDLSAPLSYNRSTGFRGGHRERAATARASDPQQMHILMIAPEPFFEPRGTPFSEYHRIRALADLGHTVDLVTYPFGSDVTLPGLRIFRSRRPPFMKGVRIGPSWAKVPLDLMLALRTIGVARRSRFDLVQSHEEGAAIGILAARWLKVPHLYDMHSSLPEQLSNFRYSRSRVLLGLFRWLERQLIRRSRVVIVICRHLGDVVRGIAPGARTVLIENAPGSGDTASTGSPGGVRETLGIGADVPVVLYTGTFEAYQGLDLLFDAMRVALRRAPEARLVLAGGDPGQVERARGEAHKAGIAAATVFAGTRPPEEIPAYLEAATVLVSPRSRGKNTPLKIYQYLRAGRPIVATNLLTHTQVLDGDVAILTDPTAEALGMGIADAILDPARSQALSQNAKRLADTKYTYEAYVANVKRSLDLLSGPATGEAA
jgi:glycosyltransferase involved in cell wall biosynthesis